MQTLGCLVAVTIALASAAQCASAESTYVGVQTDEYFVDMPASYIKQPTTDFGSILHLLLEFLTGTGDHMRATLAGSQTDSFVDADALPAGNSQLPSISVMVGRSEVPTDVFSRDFNRFVVDAHVLQESLPYLVYENATAQGGVLSKWLILEGAYGPDSAWKRYASYATVVNGTAYVIEYSDYLDAYRDGYPHFERAVASFVPRPPEYAGQDDPRCQGNARCIAEKITRVIDGDTLEVGGLPVRLALLDVDEQDTPSGYTAWRIVGAVCQNGSHALVDEDDGQTRGSHGRILGVVWCGNTNLNEFLVDIGFDRLDTRYCQASEFSKEPWAAACRQ